MATGFGFFMTFTAKTTPGQIFECRFTACYTGFCMLNRKTLSGKLTRTTTILTVISCPRGNDSPDGIRNPV